MPDSRSTMIEPPVEELLDKVDSKFTLVALSAKRARQINSYYNSLGDAIGVVVPPQVTSVSGKPLTISFEEIAAAKATFHRPAPEEEGAEEILEEAAELVEVAAETVEAVAETEAVAEAEAVADGSESGE